MPTRRYRYISIILIFLLTIPSLQAITWSKIYGTINNDYAFTIKQTPDGGYIVLGRTGNYPDLKAWMLKLDEYGDTSWSKTFDSIPFLDAMDIEIDYDSGYIMSINYGSGGSYNLRIVKTDENGNIIWSKIYDLYLSMIDYPYDLDKTTDSGYIIVGDAMGGNSQTFILKLNQNGDSLWATMTGDESYFTGVCENSENGYIATIACDPYYNRTVLKYDSLGNWISINGYNDTYTRDIEMLNDSNYIVATGNHLFKINENLDSIWSRNIGGLDAEPCFDGGFVTIATGYNNAYLNKYSTDGDSLWTVSFGGYGADNFNSVSRTSDGGYICCGYTDSWGAGGYDFYIIKTDSLGYALGVEEEQNEQPSEQSEILVKNISSGMVSISFVLGNDGYLSLSVYDLSGRIIDTPLKGYFSRGVQNFLLSDYQPGVYFYSIENENKKYQGKFQVYW